MRAFIIALFVVLACACTKYKTTASLNVRNKPTTSAKIYKTVSKGTTLCVVSISNNWAKLDSGKYVHANYIKKVSSSTTKTDDKKTTDKKTTETNKGTYNSSSLKIAQKSSPNKGSRNGWKPDVVVCHITEGAYAGAVSWLCNKRAQASCHFVVSKKGEITQLVPITQASWCQGISASQTSKATASIVKSRKVNPNWYAVGIEHEGFYKTCQGCLTDAQKKASGMLIRYIANQIKKTYGTTLKIDRDHIIGHYQINPSNKPNCPGKNFPWSEVIKIAKNTK